MKKKSIIFSLLFVIGVVLVNIINPFVVNAETDQFELTSGAPIMTGKNQSVCKVGDSLLTTVVIVNTNTGEKIEIDNKYVEKTSTNRNIVSMENDNIVATAEGITTIKYSFDYNGKTYYYEELKQVVSDQFSNGVIPVINSSVIFVPVNPSSVISSISLTQGGSYGIDFPEGYDESNYFKYEWAVADSKVAKIEKVSDSEVKVTPLSVGDTTLKCIIKTADNKETITKLVNITVYLPEQLKENNSGDQGETNTIDNPTIIDDNLGGISSNGDDSPTENKDDNVPVVVTGKTAEESTFNKALEFLTKPEVGCTIIVLFVLIAGIVCTILFKKEK